MKKLKKIRLGGWIHIIIKSENILSHVARSAKC